MPEVGRFGQVDPVTETQEDVSVYHYSRGNPIKNADPNGDFCIPCITAAAGAIIGAGVNAYDQYKSGELGLNTKSLSRIGVAAAAGGIAGSGLGGLGVAVGASIVGEAVDQKIAKGKIDNFEKIAINGLVTAATGGLLKGVEAVAVKSGVIAATKSVISSNSTVSVVSNAGKVVLSSTSRQNITTVKATTKAISESTGNIISYVAGNKISNLISPTKKTQNSGSSFAIYLLRKSTFKIPLKNQ